MDNRFYPHIRIFSGFSLLGVICCQSKICHSVQPQVVDLLEIITQFLDPGRRIISSVVFFVKSWSGNTNEYLSFRILPPVISGAKWYKTPRSVAGWPPDRGVKYIDWDAKEERYPCRGCGQKKQKWRLAGEEGGFLDICPHITGITTTIFTCPNANICFVIASDGASVFNISRMIYFVAT